MAYSFSDDSVYDLYLAYIIRDMLHKLLTKKWLFLIRFPRSKDTSKLCAHYYFTTGFTKKSLTKVCTKWKVANIIVNFRCNSSYLFQLN